MDGWGKERSVVRAPRGKDVWVWVWKSEASAALACAMEEWRRRRSFYSNLFCFFLGGGAKTYDGGVTAREAQRA